MVGMNMGHALEVAKQGITVNSVAPGWITTGSTTPVESEAGRFTPMGRAGSPREVAAAVCSLFRNPCRVSAVADSYCPSGNDF